jgi:hypothetical protein
MMSVQRSPAHARHHPIGVMTLSPSRTTLDLPNSWRSLMRGTGRVIFAATLLLIIGVVNIIYGIGALDDANIFTGSKRYILDNLNTLGWVLIILGIIQLAGGLSLMAGNTFGRVIAIIGGVLGALGALFSIGDSNPWWSLAVFVLCVYVVHGVIVFGRDERDVGVA